MTEKGWIKLHRRLLDCWIWDIKPFDKARAWVDLLLLAMHHDKKIIIENKTVTIGQGSYFTSRKKLAERWGWSLKKVDAFLKTLEEEEMIATCRTKKGTIISIKNYKDYQVEDDDLRVNKSDKTVKKEPIVYYPNNNRLDNAFKEFLSMRNKIKKPLATKQALTRMMNKIEKLSAGNAEVAIRIVEQSIDHCWQDVYELKEYSNGGSKDGCANTNNEAIETDAYADELERAYYEQ